MLHGTVRLTPSKSPVNWLERYIPPWVTEVGEPLLSHQALSSRVNRIEIMPDCNDLT